MLGDVQQPVDRLTERTTRQIERLAQERLRTINRLVRRNRDTIALDAQGAPARRGELLVLDTSEIDLNVTPSISFNVFASDLPGSTEVIDVEVEVSAILTGGGGGGSSSVQRVDGVFSALGDLLTS